MAHIYGRLFTLEDSIKIVMILDDVVVVVVGVVEPGGPTTSPAPTERPGEPSQPGGKQTAEG